MKIIITSGGTREKIDPVRYIGNFSTGKMGKALAQAFMDSGAEVKVISGAAEVHYPLPIIRVESARDMLAACEAELKSYHCDIFIACAAVADMRPKNYSENKIKKDKLGSIELIENPDILATIAVHSQRPKLVIGFAAESENHIENARKKLTKKSCDLIVLNDINAMGEDETEVWLVSATQEIKLERASKDEIARQIVTIIGEMYDAN
jgi:phosphopantothenoylcysteine decarboxylase/phosphopantothenate--cysteine ligase